MNAGQFISVALDSSANLGTSVLGGLNKTTDNFNEYLDESREVKEATKDERVKLKLMEEKVSLREEKNMIVKRAIKALGINTTGMSQEEIYAAVEKALN